MKICFNQMVLYDKASAVRLALLVVLTLFATSCIKDEEPNTECDILSIIFPSDILLRQPYISDKPEKMGSGESEKVYYSIEVMVKAGVVVTKLAHEFTLTPGATISPESGVERDFTSPQEYVTTSQDGKWHRTYVVTVKKEEPPVELQFIKYGFENVKTESKFNRQYDVFYEVDADDSEKVTMTWDSGNSGFAWSLIGSTVGGSPDVFPTFQADNGVVGKCAELITRETGPMGSSFSPPMPIAAGNLFTGKFVLNLGNPRKSTHFGEGILFRHVPLYFSGYFKYTPGEVYKAINENNHFVAVPGKTDECNIYSVLYEVTDDMPYLDGDNVLSDDNPNIIAVAAISAEDRKGSPQWKEFRVPFQLRAGKTIDPDKLESGAYSLTIVMTSSKDGDYFAGAIGSCLLVDELEITCN